MSGRRRRDADPGCDVDFQPQIKRFTFEPGTVQDVANFKYMVGKKYKFLIEPTDDIYERSEYIDYVKSVLSVGGTGQLLLKTRGGNEMTVGRQSMKFDGDEVDKVLVRYICG